MSKGISIELTELSRMEDEFSSFFKGYKTMGHHHELKWFTLDYLLVLGFNVFMA
jgi:hypothetical protein